MNVDDLGTGERLVEQAIANAADLNRVLVAARLVHKSGALSSLRPVNRDWMVQKMGQHLLENIDEIARILSVEAGKPVWEARIEVEDAARNFEYYGNQVETFEGRSIPLGSCYFEFTTYEPFSVSRQIILWNYLLEMTARPFSAISATGNTCVTKTP